MRFKAKLFKLGNSRSIYVPKSIYKDLETNKKYEWEVYTNPLEEKKEAPKVYTKETEKDKIIKGNKMEWCQKHNSWKITCGCK